MTSGRQSSLKPLCGQPFRPVEKGRLIHRGKHLLTTFRTESGHPCRSGTSLPAASSVSSIFPTFLTDQRHETHAAEILTDQFAVGCLGDLDQLLHPAGLADGHDDPSVPAELLDPRRGHMASAGGRENRVERRVLRRAPSAVAFEDFHIRKTETLEALAPKLDQIVLALDPDDLRGNAADDGCRVAGARAVLEHLIARCD